MVRSIRGDLSCDTVAYSSFSCSWVIDTFFSDTAIAKTLGLGKFGQVINGSSEVIDVKATSELNRRLPEESDKRQ
jgi:hypothetical protein